MTDLKDHNYHKDREGYIVEIIRLYLFEVFTELSIFFANDRQSYKELLSALNYDIDTIQNLQERIKNDNKNDYQFSAKEEEFLKKLLKDLSRIHNIVKGDKAAVLEIPVMKKLKPTEEEIFFVIASTIQILEMLINEISNENDSEKC